MIYVNGKHEYVNFTNKIGEFHRLDGPAYIEGDYQAWWENGKRHRIGGPAIIWEEIIEWWENGSRVIKK